MSSLCKICLAILSVKLSAEVQWEAYVPTKGDPIQEPWRWKLFSEVINNDFYCIAESDDGVLWFGTGRGVLRYDGNNWKHYTKIGFGEKSTITNLYVDSRGDVFATSTEGVSTLKGGEWQSVLNISIDSRPRQRIAESAGHQIWLATNDGLWVKEGETTRRASFQGQNVMAVYADSRNRIWVSIFGDHKVYSAKLNNEVLDWVTHDLGVTHGPAIYSVFFEDSKRRMWFGNGSKFSPTFTFSEESREWVPNGPLEESAFNINTSITECQDGYIWVSSNQDLKKISDSRTISYPLLGLRISTYFPHLYITSNNFLFIGSQQSRLSGVDLSEKKWKTYRDLQYQAETSKGQRWFLTQSGDVVTSNPSEDEWRIMHPLTELIQNPTLIFIDKDENIWITGNDGGIGALTLIKGETIEKHSFPKLGEHLSHLSALQTQDGSIYFGAGTNPKSNQTTAAMVQAIPNGNSFQFEYLEVGGPARRATNLVALDENHLLSGGPRINHFRLDPFLHISNRKVQIPIWWVERMLRSKDNHLWLAQWSIGIQRVDLESGEQVLFTEKDGLKSNLVTYLLEDADDTLWAVTESGVSRFDGTSWIRNALPAQIGFDRTAGTMRQSSDGSIWINKASYDWHYRGTSESGYMKQVPNHQDFQTIRYIPDRVHPETRITETSSSAEALRRGYLDILCSASDPWAETSTDELQFSYRINRGEWSPFSYSKTISLKDLPPGQYTLEVRSRDLELNVDPSPAKTTFEIPPPYWREWWFISIIGVVFVMFLALIGVIIYLRIRHVFEIEELKIQYFTELSHDLRTPLTLILSPIKEALAHTDNSLQKSRLSLAASYAEKLREMIEEILDFRAADSKQTQLQNQTVDLVHLMRSKTVHFKDFSENEDQKLTFESDVTNSWVECDSHRLERILDNLISNAVKHSGKGSTIRVKLESESNTEQNSVHTTVIVEDDGKGISPEDLPHLFKPYYRSKNVRGNNGIGLGLTTTAQSVKLMRGEIEVLSPIYHEGAFQKGTRFKISFHFPAAEPIKPKILPTPDHDMDKSEEVQIFIVEDQQDIRQMLENEFKDSYTVTTFSNGKDAFEFCQNEIPDLVISDVMMPLMDGWELCEKIKTTGITSHIPVVLLTAKSGEENIYRGIKTGADDYMVKPPNLQLLKAKIQQILTTHKNLREKWETSSDNDQQLSNLNKANSSFMNEVLQIVKDHLHDHEFGNEQLAKMMGLSTRSLYRKIKAVTNQSPNNIIKTSRMERSKDLITEGGYNIAEILDKVGYLEHSYFSSSFKKHFGCSPKEFQKRNRKTQKEVV